MQKVFYVVLTYVFLNLVCYFRNTVVYVKGKRGRKVPIIVTELTKVAMTAIIERTTTDEKYMFPAAGNQFMQGHIVLRKVCREMGQQLLSPQLLTSTKLRKHVATVSQVYKQINRLFSAFLLKKM